MPWCFNKMSSFITLGPASRYEMVNGAPGLEKVDSPCSKGCHAYTCFTSVLPLPLPFTITTCSQSPDIVSTDQITSHSQDFGHQPRVRTSILTEVSRGFPPSKCLTKGHDRFSHIIHKNLVIRYFITHVINKSSLINQRTTINLFIKD